MLAYLLPPHVASFVTLYPKAASEERVSKGASIRATMTVARTLYISTARYSSTSVMKSMIAHGRLLDRDFLLGSLGALTSLAGFGKSI